MNKEKKQLLDSTFQTFVEVGLGGENIGILEDIVAKNVVGFGTALDEKIFGVTELRDLLLRQKEQSAGLEISWKIKTLDIHISTDENTVIYTNEITLYITVDGNSIEMYLRFSIVLEYVQQKWMVVHWHGSKPEHVESEKDTWGVKTWKEKAEELEKEVAARTADLVEKNRELQVEAALERVRAKTMAMHNSEDVGKCIVKMFSELTGLGVDAGTRFGIGILNHNNENNQLWTARKNGDEVSMHIGNLDMASHPLLKSARKAWKEQVPLHKYVLEGEDLLNYYQMLNNAPDYKIQIPLEKLPKREIQHCFIFEHGFFYAFTPREFQPELIHITKRFTALFEQTYRRYLDLVRAEAQATEAKIEAALEKVRSRSLAMYKSDELNEVVAVLFEKLKDLQIPFTAVGIAIGIDGSKDMNSFVCGENETGLVITNYRLPYFDHIIARDYNYVLEKQMDFFVGHYSKAEKDSFYTYVIEHTPELRYLPEDIKHMVFESTTYTISMVSVKNALFAINDFEGKVLTESEIDIIKRFARVFDQAYSRFLDLQKAETQAREAQIEAALEKVRSRSMAMQKPEELIEVAEVLRQEMGQLGVEALETSSIYIIDDEKKQAECWYAIKDVREESTRLVSDEMSLDLYETWVGRQMWKFYQSDGEQTSIIMKGENRKEWINYCAMQSKVLQGYYGDEIPERTYHLVKFSGGYMGAASLGEISAESRELLKRVSIVFSLAYTRFSDLQKAEAQAREAKIEVALERVRAQAMAMHHSEDLNKTIQVYFEQLDDLIDSTIVRCGAGLLNKENTIAEMSSASKSSDGGTFHVKGTIDMKGHPLLENTYKHWLKQTEYHHVLHGNEIKEYYQYITNQVAVPENRGIDELYFYFPMFTEGSFYVVTNTKVPENELQIFRRFSSVLSLTYKRFNDLQKAEAQAREAIKQSSLDRIRGEIASMRTTTDLERITPLIWKELTTLNIPFIRCGVFIMDELLQQMHAFLSTPDGKAIAAFHLPYDTPGRSNEILASWNNKKKYIQHWDETAFSELGDLLVQQGALPSKGVYLKTVPSGGLYLHCLPFMQGMLYVGNTVKLNEDEIQLIKAVAEAFATAYARYEDFNKLESAKQQVDKALVELKQTQQQLVQSEKMASLGELTAGIAHEIQNPLNFVNNFSEVSNELIDEMNDELYKGDIEEAKAISADIKQNLEKINHHGKRAADIVKGMLQHSRSSSGKKEPTNINALADEYLRLAYHGLRAKDKSFNATLKTDFDQSIDKIEIVPQDIGRVILNLITNAFYVVNEKSKHKIAGYEPTVEVITKEAGDKVLIFVKDNGNGIPEAIKEKIFQPFFTTKPTGQGTGLGLSLSYDIVKAHGGELKVETKEGVGTEFIILLPIV